MTNEALANTISSRILHLRAGYLARTAQDIEALIVLMEQCQDEIPPPVKDELRMQLHRVAGSAGTFGFTELGAQARLMELQVRPNTERLDAASFKNSLRQLYSAIAALRDPSATEKQLVDAQSPAAPPVIAGASDLHLLIGGDDPAYCEMLASLLGSSFRVAISYTGQDVLNQYQISDADIILLDVGLPDMSGYQVCQQLDNIRPRAWRSVVFVSVNNQVEDKVAAYEAGGDDFISKPIQLDEFVAKLKNLAAYTQSKKIFSRKTNLHKSLYSIPWPKLPNTVA